MVNSKKTVGRPFRKGQTGNPHGRPKKTQEEYDLEKACKAKTPDALAVIEVLMRTADKDSVKLAAAVFIVERAHGKAVQRNELTGKDGDPIEHEFTMKFVRA